MVWMIYLPLALSHEVTYQKFTLWFRALIHPHGTKQDSKDNTKHKKNPNVNPTSLRCHLSFFKEIVKTSLKFCHACVEQQQHHLYISPSLGCLLSALHWICQKSESIVIQLMFFLPQYIIMIFISCWKVKEKGPQPPFLLNILHTCMYDVYLLNALLYV